MACKYKLQGLNDITIGSPAAVAVGYAGGYGIEICEIEKFYITGPAAARQLE